MAKICFITCRGIFDSPNLKKYATIIKDRFDIIYWDRIGKKEYCGAENYYVFTSLQKVGESKFKKIISYFAFKKYANKILKKNEYKLLIIYPTHTAWLIKNILKKKYKYNYIYDIRDYCGEKNFIIRYMTSIAIKNSGLCSITSPGYNNFLPKHNYLISNNVQKIDEKIVMEYRNSNRKHDLPIRLSFIGTIRFIKQMEKLISIFGNDERYILNFIGRGSEQLIEFCKKNDFKNVNIIGQFMPEEISKFYVETDMAINAYGNNKPELIYALSNKLYSAAIMGIPVLCSPNTYTSEIVEKYGFGFAIDLDDFECKEKLINYYYSIDYDKLLNGCNKFMDSVNAQELTYQKTISSFVNEVVRNEN